MLIIVLIYIIKNSKEKEFNFYINVIGDDDISLKNELDNEEKENNAKLNKNGNNYQLFIVNKTKTRNLGHKTADDFVEWIRKLERTILENIYETNLFP